MFDLNRSLVYFWLYNPIYIYAKIRNIYPQIAISLSSISYYNPALCFRSHSLGGCHLNRLLIQIQNKIY